MLHKCFGISQLLYIKAAKAGLLAGSGLVAVYQQEPNKFELSEDCKVLPCFFSFLRGQDGRLRGQDGPTSLATDAHRILVAVKATWHHSNCSCYSVAVVIM